MASANQSYAQSLYNSQKAQKALSRGGGGSNYSGASGGYGANPSYGQGGYYGYDPIKQGQTAAQINSGTYGQSGGSSGGGGYSGGGDGGYSEPAAPSVDWAAYINLLIAEQQRVYNEQQKKLREMTDAANANVDKNAASSIESLQGDTDEQLRQANILRQRQERGQRQAAAISGGGGGLSESAMMDIDGSYLNSRDRYNTAFTGAKKDILNQASNIKAQNESSLAQNEIDFMAQVPQYALQLASMGPEYAAAMTNPLSSFSFGLSNPVSNQAINQPTSPVFSTGGKTASDTYSRLRASGMTDAQIRLALSGNI